MSVQGIRVSVQCRDRTESQPADIAQPFSKQALREIALKQNDFARAAQGLENFNENPVQDSIRAELFTEILDREGIQSPNSVLAFDLFHAIENRDLQFTLLTTRAAVLPAEDRAVFLDRAGVARGQHIRLRPVIEIYEAANAGDWDRIQPLIDRLTRFERPRLDENYISSRALAAGNLELAFQYVGPRYPLGPDPYDQAVFTLALNGEYGRALLLIPHVRGVDRLDITYAIWALLMEDKIH